MRIAALSDVHGNLAALEAVLADIASLGVDHIVFCGDMVLGAPDDRACWKLARETTEYVVRGNTEGFVARFGTREAEPRWTTERFGPLHWTVDQFSDEERRELGQLPLTLKIPGVPDVLFYHASPRNDRDLWRSHSPDQELEEYFGGVAEEVLVGGHNHTQQIRAWRGHTLTICGSVGGTDDWSAGAQYLLLEQQGSTWEAVHRNVPYDMDSTLQRFVETDYVASAGPMGRLMLRALATRTNQVMPFLAWYKPRTSHISLADAVDAFLNFY